MVWLLLKLKLTYIIIEWINRIASETCRDWWYDAKKSGEWFQEIQTWIRCLSNLPIMHIVMIQCLFKTLLDGCRIVVKHKGAFFWKTKRLITIRIAVHSLNHPSSRRLSIDYTTVLKWYVYCLWILSLILLLESSCETKRVFSNICVA